jgi:UDP-3-O-[3-hydroxymyristoyl] glucosamine N-acyltransferase
MWTPEISPRWYTKIPLLGWAKVLEILDQERTRRPSGIHPTAVVATSASIGQNVTVGAHACCEDGAVIGDNCVLYAQVYVGFDVAMGRIAWFTPTSRSASGRPWGRVAFFSPGW